MRATSNIPFPQTQYHIPKSCLILLIGALAMSGSDPSGRGCMSSAMSVGPWHLALQFLRRVGAQKEGEEPGFGGEIG